MSHQNAIPGWLPGCKPDDYPNAADHFMIRSAVVARTTLTEAQVSEMVRTGRLTPYKVQANQKITMFRVADVDALFTPVPVSEG